MNRLLLGLLGLTLWFGATFPTYAVVPATRVGDAAYTITNTDVTVATSVAFTAARIWTLPAAAGTCIGQNCQPPANTLQIIDLIGTVTATNTLTIAPPSGVTINGNAANLILSGAGVRVVLIPTSASNLNAVVTGDFRSATLATGSAVALTSTTAADIISIALSQGTWQCSANTVRNLAAATSVTVMATSISATTGTVGVIGAGMVTNATAANVMGAATSQIIMPVRLVLAATTTYYLVARDTFSVDTNAAWGSINCYRQ